MALHFFKDLFFQFLWACLLLYVPVGELNLRSPCGPLSVVAVYCIVYLSNWSTVRTKDFFEAPFIFLKCHLLFQPLHYHEGFLYLSYWCGFVLLTHKHISITTLLYTGKNAVLVYWDRLQSFRKPASAKCCAIALTVWYQAFYNINT